MTDPIDIAEGYSAEPYGDGYIICHSGGGRAVAQLDMAAAVREIARLRAALAANHQDWDRVHHALAKHGKHPGRTDDHLADVIDRAFSAAPGASPPPAAPTVEAAHDMGAKGGPAVEAERLAFEGWMRGHCWRLGATWNGSGYISDREGASGGGYVCPVAMATRRLWAAWRDRAALAPPPAALAVPDGWALETGGGGFGEKGSRWVCVRNVKSQCGQDFYESRDPLIFGFLSALAASPQPPQPQGREGRG